MGDFIFNFGPRLLALLLGVCAICVLLIVPWANYYSRRHRQRHPSRAGGDTDLPPDDFSSEEENSLTNRLK